MFTVKDSKGNVLFKGIGGDANAWAAKNVRSYGDLYVHYYGEDNIILHYFVGDIVDVYGTHANVVTTEWV